MSSKRLPYESDESLLRATTWRSMTALGLLASFALGSLVIFWLQTRAMESGARLLNVAGRQRMLSQRAALIATELATADPAGRQLLLRQLEQVTERLMSAHRALRDGDAELGLPPPSAEIAGLYRNPPSLDERMELFAAALGELAASETPSVDKAIHRHIVDVALRGRLLAELDAVVNAYEAHEEAKVRRLQNIQLSVVVLTLVVIVATRRTVIGPMVERLRISLQALHEHHDRLARVGRLSTMGEMTAGIAHEINQPLAAINTYAFVARRQLPASMAGGELDFTLEKISAQAERAGQVIRRVRALTENRRGERELIDLEPALVDAVELAAADARFRRYRISLELAGGLPPVLIDPVQIQQVILNLIRNAAEALPAGGEPEPIVVRTAADDGRVRIEVADRGTGLPAGRNALEELFQPFFTTKESGSGLGLSMARSIIETHGGRLELVENPGGGTVARIVLPI